MQTIRRWVGGLFSWRTLLGTSTGVALLVGGWYGAKRSMPLVERLSEQVQAALVAQLQRETKLAQSIERASIGCPAASAALLPLVSERMRVLFDMEPLRHQLRTLPRDQTERKVKLWNEIKVVALSRLACTAYAVASFVALIRVLLVAMAKYEDECRAAGAGDRVDFQAMKAKVIEHGVSYVQNSGLPRLADHLRAAVAKATASWDPAAGKQVTLADVSAIMSRVRQVTEFQSGSGSQLKGARGPMAALYSPCPVVEFMVPQVDDPRHPDGGAGQVLDLTWDLMESPAFQAGLRGAFDVSFVALKAAQVPAFSASTASVAESRPTHLAKVLAGALPSEKRFLNNGSVMASVVQPIAMNPTLAELCHTLYSRAVVSSFTFPVASTTTTTTTAASSPTTTAVATSKSRTLSSPAAAAAAAAAVPDSRPPRTPSIAPPATPPFTQTA